MEPEISTWWSRRVVSPNERFARAYSSLPTLIPVHSSRFTTVASTFSRVRPGVPMSFDTRSRIAGNARLNSIIRSNLLTSRTSLHFGWYRYCLRARASRPVAWMCPLGWGQIQTSVYAGGMASDLIRAISFLSVTLRPSTPT